MEKIHAYWKIYDLLFCKKTIFSKSIRSFSEGNSQNIALPIARTHKRAERFTKNFIRKLLGSYFRDFQTELLL